MDESQAWILYNSLKTLANQVDNAKFPEMSAALSAAVTQAKALLVGGLNNS